MCSSILKEMPLPLILVTTGCLRAPLLRHIGPNYYLSDVCQRLIIALRNAGVAICNSYNLITTA